MDHSGKMNASLKGVEGFTEHIQKLNGIKYCENPKKKNKGDSEMDRSKYINLNDVENNKGSYWWTIQIQGKDGDKKLTGSGFDLVRNDQSFILTSASNVVAMTKGDHLSKRFYTNMTVYCGRGGDHTFSGSYRIRKCIPHPYYDGFPSCYDLAVCIYDKDEDEREDDDNRCKLLNQNTCWTFDS